MRWDTKFCGGNWEKVSGYTFRYIKFFTPHWWGRHQISLTLCWDTQAKTRGKGKKK